MDQTQQQIYNVLQQNVGNRLTAELINGLTARLHAIVQERINRAAAEQEEQGDDV